MIRMVDGGISPAVGGGSGANEKKMNRRVRNEANVNEIDHEKRRQRTRTGKQFANYTFGLEEVKRSHTGGERWGRGDNPDSMQPARPRRS